MTESSETKPTEQNQSSPVLPTGIKQNKKTTSFPRPLVYFFGVIALLLVGFIAGQSFERIRFRHDLQWRDNYQQNFSMNFQPENMRRMITGFAPGPMRSHGLLGNVLSLDSNKLTVQDEDGNEQSIQIDDKTNFRLNNNSASVKDLKTGQRIAIFGRPNDNGQIYATLIRIFSEEDNTNTPTVSPTATSSPLTNLSK